MIVWLSDWLSDIIAVILLAVLVELLLPNKAMQRYARLVVGLFILLTIISPILKLLQSDISNRLEAGMELWNEHTMTQNVKMPGLEEIERRAADIQERRNEEAARLTEQALEQAMFDELSGQLDARIESVDAELLWNEHRQAGKIPSIGIITVTLKPPEEAAVASGRRSEAQAVEPVSIDVEIKLDKGTSETAAADNEQYKSRGFVEAGRSDIVSIQTALKHGWGVHPDRVVIRQRADDRIR